MLIVNPNLCIDRTIDLEVLVPGNVHRTAAARTSLGGKGVNVGRVARRFGHEATILGFVPDGDRARLERLAAEEGAAIVGVEVAGVARVASILLEASGRVTVLNEPGPTVDARHWAALLARCNSALTSHQSVACSGSLPPGSPSDGYARVALAARAAGVRAVVDATGEVLASALLAAPEIVSPNLSEAEAVLLGRTGEVVEHTGPDVVERAADCVVGLVERGAKAAIVSAGSHGAAFNVGERVAWCAAPRVHVVNPIGAGDSMVGGLIHALERGDVWPEAVRFAVATASASCEHPVAGGIEPARVDELLAQLAPLEFLAGHAVAGARG